MHIATFDEVCQILGTKPDTDEILGMRGFGWYELRDDSGDLKELATFKNAITNHGDEYYARRAAMTSPSIGQVTGMRLGTSNTAVAKSGTGSAIVTYAGTGITASKAIDGTHPTFATAVPGCQVQWKTSWSAGECTVNGLAEVALSTLSPLGDSAGSATDTIARALLSPVINKGASDTLAITWNHVLLGALS